jgi:hypothetical protein
VTIVTAPLPGNEQRVVLFRSEPSVDGTGSPNGWVAGANEVDLFTGTWSVTAVALCATVT